MLLVAALVLGARGWLADHPQHDPWAPLDLRQERGWATESKLAALKDDPEQCRKVLARSQIAFTALDPTGSGECARPDRLTLGSIPLSPGNPQMTCSVAAGLVLWLEQDVQAIAERELGSRVQRVEQLGTYSCRRMYGAGSGRWSEHATGNAIDISAFVLENGERISLLGDWQGDDAEARFLRAARDAACDSFATVLSPDYNAAHADHFHFDQTGRTANWSVCR